MLVYWFWGAVGLLSVLAWWRDILQFIMFAVGFAVYGLFFLAIIAAVKILVF